MTEQIHKGETNTSEDTVRSLLRDQCPAWAELPASYLSTSGTSNAMWRLHDRENDLAVRLPRTNDYAAGVAYELKLLPQLSRMTPSLPFLTPTIRHAGEPNDVFPLPWAVFDWLDGDDAWLTRDQLDPESPTLALEIVSIVEAIGAIELDVPNRRDGDRGGPIRPLLAALDHWLDDPIWSASDLLDVAAVRRSAHESLEVADSVVEPCFVHGDLLPGNVLLDDGHVTAVIDWSNAGWGDPAQDLSLSWAMLDERGREIFRDAVGADDATWLRARAFELEHAVGGILYYRPKGHQLADVMERTLHQILGE